MTREQAAAKIRYLGRNLRPRGVENIIDRILSKCGDAIDDAEFEVHWTTDRAARISDHKPANVPDEVALQAARSAGGKARAKKFNAAKKPKNVNPQWAFDGDWR